MKRNVIVAAAAAAAVIGGGTLAGVAFGDGGADPADTAPASAAQDIQVGGGDSANGTEAADDTSGGGAEGATGAGSPPELAIATAVDHQPGVVTEIELSRHAGERGWEIELLGDDDEWYELDVNLEGTEVLNAHRTDDGDRDDAELLRGGDALSAAEAVRIAQEHTGAGLREADVDDDGHWEVELRDGDGVEYELDVDLRTGEITAQERDDDRDDDWDDRDDRDDDWDDRGDDDGDDDGDD